MLKIKHLYLFGMTTNKTRYKRMSETYKLSIFQFKRKVNNYFSNKTAQSKLYLQILYFGMPIMLNLLDG